MPHSIPAFFESYANLYNRALAGENVFDEIQDRFSQQFIAAGPASIASGKQGAPFRRTLERGYRFYRSIGTKKMTARRVETTPIDPTHCLAKVCYCAEYKKKGGTPLTIEFAVSYLLDTSGARPKIFAFVAGDEMATYKKHGLVPDDPKPPPVKGRTSTADRTRREGPRHAPAPELEKQPVH
jgi:hypothetical protein